MNLSARAWFGALLLLALLLPTRGMAPSDVVALAQARGAQQPASGANADANPGDSQGELSGFDTSVGGNCFAVVRASGVAARASCFTRSSRLAVGQYEVIFTRSVSTCAFLATLGHVATSGLPVHGLVTVSPRGGNPNGVFVATYTPFGTFQNPAPVRADRAFHLGLFCQ